MNAEKSMTIGQVAKALGVTVMRVRQLDDDLKPIRIGHIKMRLYKPENVERVRKERAKAKKAS